MPEEEPQVEQPQVEQDRVPEVEKEDPILKGRRLALANDKEKLEELLIPYGGKIDQVSVLLQYLGQSAQVARKLTGYYEMASREAGPGRSSDIKALGALAENLTKSTQQLGVCISRDMKRIEQLARLVMRNSVYIKNAEKS